jgi:hypothetical protein
MNILLQEDKMDDSVEKEIGLVTGADLTKIIVSI